MRISSISWNRPSAPSRSVTKITRQRIHPCHYLYVRKVGGRKYQARAWLPLPLGSINLGLYDHERDAWIAAKAWIQAGASPVHHLPKGVLPKWVIKAPAGNFYARRASAKRNRTIVLGPFGRAEDAHAAMVNRLKIWMQRGVESFQPTLLEVCGL